MPASVLGAFATPYAPITQAAAQATLKAAEGSFGLPPQIGAVLDAVSVSQDSATAAANKVQAVSPTANRPAEDLPATGATAGWRQWLTGWRLVAVIGGVIVVGWMLLGRRRRHG